MARASTFTSYINAELPSDLNTKWQRYEQVATKTYSNIAQAAANANRQIAGLQGGRGTAGTLRASKNVERAVEKQARQLREVGRVNEGVARQTERTTRTVASQGNAFRRTAKDSNQLARGLSAVSTSLNIVQGPLGPLAGRVSAVSRAVSDLTGFRLGLAGVASSLFVIGSVGNTYQQLTARLRGAYDSQLDVSAAMSEIAGIAARTRQSLEPVADSYIKLTKAGEDFNISQERTAKVLETISKAAILSGGTRQSQEAGLTQFAQGFASGNLAGDELKSVRENTFVLAQTIAKGLGIQVGELKKFAAEGKLTTEVLVQALEKGALEIDARFERMPKTFSQATTELRNSFTLLVGSFDETLGFSNKLAGAVSALAGALPALATAAVGVGAAFAGVKLVSFIDNMAKAMNRAQVMSGALKQLAQRRLQSAQAEEQSARRSKAALDAQQKELNDLIALEQRRQQLARNDRERLGRDPAKTSAQVRAAIEAERQALVKLQNLRASAKVTTEALAAAELKLAAATKNVEQAQARAAAQSGRFATAVRGLIGAINPLGIAIGLVTTALFALATRASATKDTLSEFGAEAVTAAREAIGLAKANGALAQSFYDVARARGRLAKTEAEEKRNEVGEELGGRLRKIRGEVNILAAAEGDGTALGQRLARDAARLEYWEKQLESGTVDVGRLNRELQALAKSTPEAFRGPTSIFGLFEVGSDASQTGIENSLAALTLRQEQVRKAIEDEAEIEKLIEEAEKEIKAEPNAPTLSAATLRAQAIAEAADAGTNQIKAAGARRKAAMAELNEEFVSGGKVEAGREEEYKERIRQIEQTYQAEVQGARAAAAARTAGARQAKADAAQEKKDQRELLGLELQRNLLALEQRRPDMGEEEYYNERIRLLETYDAEIEKIDETAVHSSKALAQMIKDTRELQKAGERRREQRSDVLDRYSDAPRALTQAQDRIEDLQNLVGKLIADATGKLYIYTQGQADADKRLIMEGVVAPLREAQEAADQFAAVSQLRLDGYDLVADALERALQYQEEIGSLTREQFDDIVRQEEQQRAINAQLAQRERLMQPLLDQARGLRTEFEELLVNLPTEGAKSIGDFFKQMQANAARVWARRLSESLFGDAEEKVRELVGGSKKGVDAAYEYLARHAKSTGDEFAILDTAAGNASSALDELAASARNASNAQGAGGVGGSAKNTIQALVNGVGVPGAGLAKDIANAIGGKSGLKNTTGATIAEDGTIVVTGQRSTARSRAGSLPTSIGEEITSGLNGVLGGLGDKVGSALIGAGQGMFASGIADMLGIGQSATGAAIGGAIGSFIPIPGGSFIGGLIGGTIGGLFKKKKYGTANITGPDSFTIAGNSGGARDAAGSLAETVLDQLNSIADAVGGTVGSFNTSIGTYRDNFRVSTTGTRGSLRGPTGSESTNESRYGLYDFGDDAEAAIAFAVADAVADGAIEGISMASQRILQSGQDLAKAIEKVVAIESIPRRLKALKDPVGFAIDELNREFAKLIAYLQEGGATAQQFAEAEELYLLERERAIEQATSGAFDAISSFMEDMIAGPSSPLNRRTVYDNAAATLEGFRDRINAGEVVDEQKLLEAASNFQDASRDLFGSGAGFFSDFDDLYALLEQARNNLAAGTTDPENLGPSPFDGDSSVRALIDQYNSLGGAIDDQTGTLADILTDIRDTLRGDGGAALNGYGGSSIGGLPGFAGGGGGGGGGTNNYDYARIVAV